MLSDTLHNLWSRLFSITSPAIPQDKPRSSHTVERVKGYGEPPLADAPKVIARGPEMLEIDAGFERWRDLSKD